jgi:general secretion pathway protein F
MPFFRYSARDSQGKALEGTISAESADEALFTLSQRGFKGTRILQDAGAPAPSQAAAPSSSPSAAGSVSSSAKAGATTAAPNHAGQKIIRTRKGKDKERFFLFSQVAQQLRAGINPAQVFTEIGRLTHINHFKDSFNHIAQATTAGGSISDVMQQYPDLYPSHVVGMVRAGEEGGFLPDAFQTLSDHAGESHKFKRFHWFVWLVGLNALLAIPLVYGFRRGLLGSWAIANEGQQANFLMEVVRPVLTVGCPLAVLAVVVMLLMRYALGSLQAERIRHRAGYYVPHLRRRAQNEGLAMFSWTLARLARGGVAPYRAWPMAAESVPNLVLRERLAHLGTNMRENTRLSEVVYASDLFPQEYAPMVATGEVTGNIAGTLEQLTQVTQAEYDSASMRARFWSGSLGCTTVLITGGILLIVVMKTWYGDIVGGLVEGAFE